MGDKPRSTRQKSLDFSKIEKIIDELHKNFSNQHTAKNKPYIFPFELKESMIYDENIVSVLSKISENMSYYLGLFKIPTIVYIDEGLDLYHNQNNVFSCSPNGAITTHQGLRDFAGLYEKNNLITIVNKKGYSLKHLLGIMVHEITHHFLANNGIRKQNIDENEILTDLACIYLGFGHILYPAYKLISYNTDWNEQNDKNYSYISHEKTIGYITPKTILKTICITAKRKNWNLKDVLTNFSNSKDKLKVITAYYNYLAKIRIGILNS